MKKNNTYLADDEIDLRDIIKSLWREKILILSISIICGLASYLYASLQPQNFKTEITLRNAPAQIFEPFNLFNINNSNNNNSNNNNSNNNNNNIAGQFISDFKLNILSLDNLESFLEQSREFDNFKGYLKSRNISAKEYYFKSQKFGEAKEKSIIIPNKYFLIHPKELDGNIFLNKYVEFIKKKTIVELKNNLKLSILNTINNHEQALEIAKKVQLEYPIPIIITTSQPQVVNEPEALFYKGTKVIAENLNYLNKRLIKLENDQFVFDIILQKPMTFPNNTISLFLYFAVGLLIGLFLSLGFIFFKGILKE